MKRHRKLGVAVGLAVALTVVMAVAASASTHQTSSVKAGGTLNVGWEASFGFTDNFDPTGEYLGDAWGIYSNLLLRTLVGYNHVANGPGNVLVPDIATTVPKPTDGGLTYTYHLKSGIKFSPPVNRAVTSADIKYALDRLANPKDGGEYGFYYAGIKGWAAVAAGKAKTISGVSTPNASTIVIHLTKPNGGFNYAMAMPATSPMPVEVAKCFEGKPGAYSADLVSTAGYMIAGMDKVDDSSCAALKPASGFNPKTNLDLVRNPNYDQATDSKAARENLVDAVNFTVDSSSDDIFNKIENGDLDMATSSIPPAVLKKYSTSSSLKQYFHQNSGDRTWYITMNLTQAPFDDIHVRKALNYIIDKTAMVQAWGGPTIGTVATHIAPPSMIPQEANYNPYKTPGNNGSLALAKKAMMGSKYDTSKNGMCDASACKNVLFVSDVRAVDTAMWPVIEADAKKIGITFKLRSVTPAYPVINTPKNNVPISDRSGWGKDYADPLTFFNPLFDGRTILAEGNENYSLVGITKAMAAKVGATGDLSNIPSVDAQIDKCTATAGAARFTCYANLDKTLMTKVVPWVPYLWSSVTRITSTNVTKYVFDQFGTTPAYAHIAVK